MESMFKIKGVVQEYSWGGYEFIPALLGITNEAAKPFAEYWLGDHPKGSATIVSQENKTLQQAIAENKEGMLGQRVAQAFGSLPFLLKILDVRQMLSIQVHPSKTSAAEGYKKEEAAGIAVTAAHRNYKDQNHKPESMVALGDFWLLHGFKNPEKLQAVFHSVPAFQFLAGVFNGGGYKGLYEAVMTMPQAQVNKVLAPLMQEIVPAYSGGKLDKSDPAFWAARAVQTFCKDDNYDRGIFSIYLFNLLHLKNGEGIFQPAGLPHAYLEGKNVEVMAASDNVLRAGLTDKHIDVAELMKHVIFEPTEPNIIRNNGEAEQVFPAPVAEYLLKKYDIENEVTFTTESATILLAVAGKGKLEAANQELFLGRGEAAFVGPGQQILITPTGSLLLFSVTAPVAKI